ncbi:serine hydrolase domain-containing protein [Catellatospora sp. KI3]|uniref:serine hydrolase domain-containing protein n=1 Tax=Catellatospora sp. KI3 TaxID=3041620 RepID=UPI0024831C70|nr:serine hydrolase domain-containing protein [Catellatospora sp. KI3]MDI1465591.1 serine hydrolase domain-containing protein [Catellatospora sp. KI3]
MANANGALERLVRQVQAQARVPALSVALRRADRPVWMFQVGASGNPDAPLDAATPFRIGSITKTFTAVLVLQCRDAGLLDLDDPISTHVKVPAHGAMTIRRLLSHTGGLQREPFGDIWDTLAPPDLPGLLDDLAGAEAVHPPSRRFHYSNLGFALLGHVAEQRLGGRWWELVAERVCGPLGLSATTYDAPAHAAVGYLVDEYSDHARPEPNVDVRAAAPAAQLWSTAADMAAWSAFLADPKSADPQGRVLAAATLDEARWPLTPRHETVWGSGIGLGLMLWPQPGRAMHVGHNGAMPGFLAATSGRHGGAGNPGGMSCAVLASSGTASEILNLPHELMAESLAQDPADITAWTPGEPAPEQLRSVLGRWWGEGYEHVFRWRDGALTAAGADDPADLAPSVFAQVPGQPELLRTVSGREVGELLRLTRDEHGEVVRMHWATYRFTRRQESFDGVWASHP